MIIYQVHQNHGRHMAYTHAEAENNRKAGWKDVTEDEFYGKTKKVDSVLQEGAVPETIKETPKETPKENGEDAPSFLIARYEKRFGKKPDGRLSAASIRRELDDDGA